MSIASPHNIYNSYADAWPGGNRYGGEAQTIADTPLVDQAAGEPSIQRLIPRDGMELVACRQQLAAPHSLRMKSEGAMLELSFLLEGSGEFEVSGIRHELKSGSCSLQLMRNFQVEFAYSPVAPIRSFAIGISARQFDTWMLESEAGSGCSFDQLLGAQAFRLFRMPIPAEFGRIVGQLMSQTGAAGGMHRLHAEGKALELLALSFETFLFEREADNSKSPALSRSDRDRIHRAKEMLLSAMACPPSLVQLARMAGLNEYKLKLGFKQELGTSVFAYLRMKRLETAHELLRQGDASVSQAAAHVGFANFSHFAQAFRKEFGINPSEVRRGCL